MDLVTLIILTELWIQVDIDRSNELNKEEFVIFCMMPVEMDIKRERERIRAEKKFENSGLTVIKVITTSSREEDMLE